MNIEAIVLCGGERQTRQEGDVSGIELFAGPVDSDGPLIIHALRHPGRRAVMIAEKSDRTAFDKRAYHVDAGSGVGAVADIVPQKHHAVDRVAAGMRKTGFESLFVGMNVCEQGDQHGMRCVSSA